MASKMILTEQVVHVIGQVSSVMLDIHVQSLGVERRGRSSFRPSVANHVRWICNVNITFDPAILGWLVARAIAEITGLVHVQPKTVYR